MIDGRTNYPGCNCGNDCAFPCWQRYGTAPACEACACAAFAGDAPPDATDRADELRAMPDIWPVIAQHLADAAGDPVRQIADGLHVEHAALEEKYRKGEAEHDRGWLDMTRDQIEAEIVNEWLDLVLYHAMIRARFGKEPAA